MERALQAVIFDFDFTLADSSRGIVECVSNALVQMGLAAAPAEAIVATIGLSLADTFTQLTGKRDPLLAKQFAECFHRRADQCMDAATIIYECVGPVMRSLRVAGLRTAIVTTKLNRRIRSILGANNMLDLIDVVVGADDVARTKPDPEGLLLALTKLGVPATSALYVGDHVIDAEAASNAGVPFVAALTASTCETHLNRILTKL